MPTSRRATTPRNRTPSRIASAWHLRRRAGCAVRRPHDAARGQRGFTLLEVLVSGFLVGLIALAVAPMMLLALQTSAAAQESTELTAIGSQQLEVIRALPFADAQLVAGGSIVASSAGYSLDPYLGNADRYVRWEVIDENASRKRIRLVVGERASIWGPPRETLLETFRTDIQ